MRRTQFFIGLIPTQRVATKISKQNSLFLSWFSDAVKSKRSTRDAVVPSSCSPDGVKASTFLLLGPDVLFVLHEQTSRGYAVELMVHQLLQNPSLLYQVFFHFLI